MIDGSIVSAAFAEKLLGEEGDKHEKLSQIVRANLGEGLYREAYGDNPIPTSKSGDDGGAPPKTLDLHGAIVSNIVGRWYYGGDEDKENKQRNIIWPALFERRMRAAIDDNNGEGDIRLSIDSPGGSVYAGSKIAGLLERAMKNENVNFRAEVDGICASAATMPFMTCDDREAFELANFVFHEARFGIMFATITVKVAEKITRELVTYNVQLRKYYANRSAKSEQWWAELMAEDRTMSANEAHKYGLCELLSPKEKAADKGKTAVQSEEDAEGNLSELLTTAKTLGQITGV